MICFLNQTRNAMQKDDKSTIDFEQGEAVATLT